MSPTLLILKNYTTFKDVQMILKHFFDISTGFRYKKIEKSSPSIYRDVHGWAHHNFITLYYMYIVLFMFQTWIKCECKKKLKTYLRIIGALRIFFYLDNQKIVSNTYLKVASSRSVCFSILKSFSLRSQNVSIKFPLHN